MRKLVLIAMPVLLALLIFSLLLSQFGPANNELLYTFFAVISISFVLFPLVTMFWYGTFRKRRWGRVGYLGIAAVIIGALFRLQHWPGGAILPFCGGLLIIVLYLIHFISKRDRKILDWLKLAYTVSAFVSFLAAVRQMVSSPVILLVHGVILFSLFIAFYIHILNQTEEDPVALDTDGRNVFRYEE
ncbi:MAG: hypothetical protein EOP49_08565 [Sphingobacteriales bacterium]|nr:MAG: hypothetical protein EOP49_08565 [Sphingobacteriales bacterium]